MSSTPETDFEICGESPKLAPEVPETLPVSAPILDTPPIGNLPDIPSKGVGVDTSEVLRTDPIPERPSVASAPRRGSGERSRDLSEESEEREESDEEECIFFRGSYQFFGYDTKGRGCFEYPFVAGESNTTPPI